MTTPFQQITVSDTRHRERIAIFSRPAEARDTIIITTPPGGDFHLDAGTLNIIAEVLSHSPSQKTIV